MGVAVGVWCRPSPCPHPPPPVPNASQGGIFRAAVTLFREVKNNMDRVEKMSTGEALMEMVRLMGASLLALLEVLQRILGPTRRQPDKEGTFFGARGRTAAETRSTTTRLVHVINTVRP